MVSSSATDHSLYEHTTLWLEGADLWNKGGLCGAGGGQLQLDNM